MAALCFVGDLKGVALLQRSLCCSNVSLIIYLNIKVINTGKPQNHYPCKFWQQQCYLHYKHYKNNKSEESNSSYLASSIPVMRKHKSYIINKPGDVKTGQVKIINLRSLTFLSGFSCIIINQKHQ